MNIINLMVSLLMILVVSKFKDQLSIKDLLIWIIALILPYVFSH